MNSNSTPVIIDDRNKDQIEPDKLIDGLTWYVEFNKLEIIFEVLAKYVSKIYGGQYLKCLIKNQAGVSLLDIITLSDISYTLCLHGWSNTGSHRS